MNTQNDNQPEQIEEIDVAPSAIEKPQNKGKKSRAKQSVLVLIALLIIGGAGYAFYSNQKAVQDKIDLSPSEVEQLGGDEKTKVLEAQLASLQAEEGKLTPESSRSDRFTTYIQLGEVYTALGRHDEAIQALDKIKEERKGNTRLWMTYALVYKNKGDLEEARKNNFKAIDIDQELADNWLFFFTLLSDVSTASQEEFYKEAVTRSGNLPEIVSAYEKWKTEQSK